MKAIFVTALFIFAAQASLIDTTSYTLGFTSQLGLDISGVATGLKCFQAVNTTIATAYNLVQDLRQSPEFAMFAGINLMTVVNGDLKVNCEQYFQDLVTLVIQKTNTTDFEPEEIKEVIEQNAKFYLPQLLQQITIYLDAIIAQNNYKAGATEAYIIQILLGLQKPAQIKQPVFNFTQYVPLDTQKYITEFTQAYFANLHADPEASYAFVQCYNSLAKSESAIGSFIKNFRSANTLAQKVFTIQSSSDSLMEVIENCVPAIEYNLEAFAPVWEQVKHHPLQAIITIAHNLAMNAPEIEQKEINESYDIFTGKYTEAGNEAASVMLTTFAGAGY